MIQRKQSIFLAVSIILLIYFSIGASIITYTGNDISYLLTSNNLITRTEGNPEAAITGEFFFIGSVFIALWLIFVLISFRNLSKQLTYARIGNFGYLILLAIVFSTYFIGVSITDNPTIAEHSASFQLGTYLLLVSYGFYWMAIRYIKKDKKLIESVDRIR